MIQVEGRVLAGLDEFMLRIGHLAALARVALEMGASWRRIERELADILSKLVDVDGSSNLDVARYLAEKKLCKAPRAKAATSQETDVRYPDLEVYRSEKGDLTVRTMKEGAVKVSWQDRNLAHPDVRSRVGAITWSAKAGSKTGLSHVRDWAQLLEVVNASGQLSPTGRLLVTLTGSNAVPYEHWNPYLLGHERLFFAFEYFRRDLDIFSRFAPKLLQERPPLTKATCQGLFVAVLGETAKDAERSKLISPREKFELHKQMRDLERSARRADRRIGETSTAWHRAASRLEMLTDFGLLEKSRADEKEKYQYVYYPTKLLEHAVSSLRESATAEAWIYQHLAGIIFGVEIPFEQEFGEPVLPHLSQIVRALSLPTTLLPIHSLALGLTYLRASEGHYISLQQSRSALESLPLQEPGVARLARGREGTRAEFLSVNLRKVTPV
jgi:hypothetical protein